MCSNNPVTSLIANACPPPSNWLRWRAAFQPGDCPADRGHFSRQTELMAGPHQHEHGLFGNIDAGLLAGHHSHPAIFRAIDWLPVQGRIALGTGLAGTAPGSSSWTAC
jgi:hypothetical protein